MISASDTRARRVCLSGCVLALAALLLGGCASGNPITARTTPSAPLTGTVGPSPVTGRLAPPPQNCTLTPPPQQMHLDSLGGNDDVQLLGEGPFWIYGIFYAGVLHLGQFGYQGWPIDKIVVEVGPNYTQPVTLRLQDQATGALAWWTDGNTPPLAATQTLVLDPQTDLNDVGSVPGVPDVPHGAPDPGWKEWGIFPLFTVAGCYALQVSWAGGSWQSVFAAGD